jgi:hypothetical protein
VPLVLGLIRAVLGVQQRHLAKPQYYVELPSDFTIAVWDGALENYGPNCGNYYGGRLIAAWLDREPPNPFPPLGERVG